LKQRLGLSAFLGTGLRTTFHFLSDDTTGFSGQRLLTEATAGLLLAFSFVLLYLAGGIALTGDVKHLTLTAEPDFTRVAISTSLSWASPQPFCLRQPPRSCNNAYKMSCRAENPIRCDTSRT
jgi:hypothetical protein